MCLLLVFVLFFLMMFSACSKTNFMSVSPNIIYKQCFPISCILAGLSDTRETKFSNFENRTYSGYRKDQQKQERKQIAHGAL